jgi:hypothetical protein
VEKNEKGTSSGLTSSGRTEESNATSIRTEDATTVIRTTRLSNTSQGHQQTSSVSCLKKLRTKTECLRLHVTSVLYRQLEQVLTGKRSVELTTPRIQVKWFASTVCCYLRQHRDGTGYVGIKARKINPIYLRSISILSTCFCLFQVLSVSFIQISV